MRIEIPLSDVKLFLSNQYNIDIDLMNVGVNKIEATYIDSVVLIIDEVKENVMSFHYKVDGLATIVTKVAHFFLKEKLDNTLIEWDSKNSELKIDLNKLTELKNIFEFVFISELHFIKDAIVFELLMISKT